MREVGVRGGHVSNTIPTERLLERVSRSASQSKTILKRSLSLNLIPTGRHYMHHVSTLRNIRFNQSHVCSRALLGDVQKKTIHVL